MRQPRSFGTGLKRAIDQAALPRTPKSMLYYNKPTIQRLRLAGRSSRPAKASITPISSSAMPPVLGEALVR